jgi:hypothetical protein
MGLRNPREIGQALLHKVITMEESTTYQLIIEKGEARGLVEGARRALLAAGKHALGRPFKKT